MLVFGGNSGQQGIILASSELFDPVVGSWTGAGGLNDSRFLHMATLLADGAVLTTGGSQGSGGAALSSAEIYAP